MLLVELWFEYVLDVVLQVGFWIQFTKLVGGCGNFICGMFLNVHEALVL